MKPGRWLVAHRGWLLALGVGLGVGLALFAPPLQYDRSIENMFAPGDPVRQAYERLTRRFSANEIILAVYDDPQLFDESGEGLQRLEQVGRKLASAPGVAGILSLSVLNQSLERLDVSGFFRSDSTPPLLRDTKLAEQLVELFEGFTHGSDRRTVGIACLLTSRNEVQAGATRRATVDALRSVMESLPDGLAPGMITGEPVMVADGFRFVEQDGKRLTWTSTLLVALCIAGLFRSLRWMLIPLVVVQLALMLTRGWLGISQSPITLVSSMMSAILTVISVAAIVHIIVAVRREMSAGATANEAMERSLSRLAAPIFWSAVTDAVGFAALMVSDVGPVADYGRIMTLGSLLVLPAIFLLTPGLALLGPWDRRPHRAWGEAKLDDSLALSSRLIKRHPTGLGVIAFVGALVCVSGVFRMKLETDFTRSFRQDNPLVRAYAYVEEHLGGAGVWDMMLPAPATLDGTYLKRVEALQQELRELRIGGEPAFTKVLSLADAIEVAGASPALRWAPPETRAKALAIGAPEFFATMRTTDTNTRTNGASGAPDGVSESTSWIRVMLRSRERQESEDKRLLIDQANAIMHKHFGGETRKPEVSGFFVLLATLVESAIRDQWRCFAIALAAMGVTLSIALRSAWLAALALVTNMMPVLAVMGITGWIGIRVNLGVAMIAAVALGLSVDSSLHYLFEFRRQRNAGATIDEALSRVQQGVGRAMLFSTLSLVAGFLVLTTSPFVPTVTFGWLTALAMTGGVAGNLVVLPVLLSLSRRFVR